MLLQSVAGSGHWFGEVSVGNPTFAGCWCHTSLSHSTGLAFRGRFVFFWSWLICFGDLAYLTYILWFDVSHWSLSTPLNVHLEICHLCAFADVSKISKFLPTQNSFFSLPKKNSNGPRYPSIPCSKYWPMLEHSSFCLLDRLLGDDHITWRMGDGSGWSFLHLSQVNHQFLSDGGYKKMVEFHFLVSWIPWVAEDGRKKA